MGDSLSSNIRQFVSIWQQPRVAIALFLKKKTPFTHLRIVIFLALFFLLQLGALLLAVRQQSLITPFFSWKGGEMLVWIGIGLAGAITVILSLASLVLDFLTRLLGGVGTLAQTKSAVYWSSMNILPISFFFLLFIACGKIELIALDQGLSRPILPVSLQFFSAVGILVFLIYGLIILSKMLSELHKISIWRAFASTLLGLGISLFLSAIILKMAIHRF